MPKVKISEYSATANSNTDVASINIDEGCAPSGINNAIRAVMGHLKDFQQGTNGDPFNGPHNGTVGATTPSTGAFTTLTTTGAVTVNGGAASTAIAIPNGASNPVNAYGATTASTLFAIANTGGTSYFGNEGSTAGVSFTGTSAYATVVGTSAARQLQFVTNSAVQATINSTGLFGLGVLPTGTTKFQVVSAGNSVASFQDSSAQGIKYVVATDGAGQIKHFATWEASGVNAYHAWYVTTSVGVQPQAMTLDNSGNLLVGTTTASANFYVYGAPVSYAGLNTTAILSSSASQSTGTGGLLAFEGKYTSGGALANFAAIGGLKENSTDSNYSGYLGFYTRSNGSLAAERARIDSSGTLLVSTTSNPLTSTCKFVVYGGTAEYNAAFYNSSATNPFGAVIRYSAAAPNGTGNQFLDCIDTGATRAQIRSDGGLANYSANNVNLSDRREKTNFAPAKSYLAVICAIPVQTFNYIDQNLEDDGGLTLGVVAQDVQAVAPELVMESNWASKDEEPKMRLSIYQTDLQYALMKALQELKAEFDAYKASHP